MCDNARAKVRIRGRLGPFEDSDLGGGGIKKVRGKHVAPIFWYKSNNGVKIRLHAEN